MSRPEPYPGRIAHTYSIVARDERTGDLGVAVQSHWFSVGTTVAWARAGVGAVATQAMANPAIGPDALALMQQGASSQDALGSVLEKDPGRELRQVGVIDTRGLSSAHTGARCIEAAGHRTGKGYSVQANMMTSDKVWPAMAEEFESSHGQLAERMLATLEAAEEAGGDIRGRQSACLLVVRGHPTGMEWKDRLVDLRVDDSSNPVKELRRLLKVHRAYEHMDAGDIAMEEGKMDVAKDHYSAAEEMFPYNEEMAFWHAVTLANVGDLQGAIPLFSQVFERNPDYKVLAARLVPVNMLRLQPEEMERILR
ncbi:MAG: hypothetical protein A4E32_00844 [Methanomassiliicoccales archaeon PtaU1.Bin124]|nr:MAG: hypothetical protein A4E32_00844 [Methanomassiliicoccales archaeon PtaU1.Bin124]